ncbi:gamma-glutamyltransferase family protein [Pseudonocardia sp. DSM 110487]|uniref:gamma-glutamyltransferase family protein n=1 Tax=Pseudonocardia sp. DSM 110487 TaxID=2865833 RepID=UPI001C696C57|nr:gamma-glutamyltransferase family protein [Pseudonocardia sp. DSM 110487]QYN37475.1 gamma-glutamyltransferase family protein [Pseudonocardia sp. DSM 110487]
MSATTAAAVASPHHSATETGAAVLADGGTALDAAIATNAMLSVVYPHMCGLGGDLFLLYFEAATGSVHCLNASGPAPGLATRAAFADLGLDHIPQRGPLPVTVPGTVAGWQAAHQRFGRLPWRRLLEPAASAARDGTPVSPGLAKWIAAEAEGIGHSPGLRPLLGAAVLRQPELAATFDRIITRGADDFYRGETARRIDDSMRRHDGLLRFDDLDSYTPEWVAPTQATYAGLEVYVPPPNSQGVTSLLMLKALQALGAEGDVPGTAEHITNLVAAKRTAFALRDRHVTDPAYVTISTEDLLDALPAPEAPATTHPVGGDTVAFVSIDRDGNACSAIQSVYYGFGSMFVPEGTGIIMQNRGHYFSLSPDHVNTLEPGKRTMHTLMASMALRDGRPRFVVSSMGADGQPQFNVQVLQQLLAGGTPQEAVSRPRVLHGRFVIEDDPDVLHVEPLPDADVVGALQRAGHDVRVTAGPDDRMGHAHAIAVAEDGSVLAGADPRSDGSAIVVAG